MVINMNLSLYQSYLRTEIEQLFPGKATPAVVASTFLVTSKLLICIIDTRRHGGDFVFNKPSELTWSPKLGTPEAINMVACQLPEPLEQAFASQNCSRLLFVSNDSINYQYVGEIGLSFVGVRPSVGRIASFYITPKLSRIAWSQFGGYSHWHLTVNSRMKSLSQDDDLERSLAPEWREDVVDVFLTRYEEDYIHVVVNGDAAVVMYMDQARGIDMASRNAKYSGKPRAIIHLMGFDHADWDTLARDVVSRGEALELLKAFFRTGEPQGLVGSK
jgi:hypothetical protein